MRFFAGQLILLLVMAGTAMAGPIYVYREASGSIRFTSNKPPAYIKASTFSGSNLPFSITGKRGFPSRICRDCYKELISRVSSENEVDPALIKAVIHAESGFNPSAISKKGAQGLMQLMPDTARQHGVKRPFEPAENIAGGVRHLAMLLKKYDNDLTKTIAAYNAGSQAVDRHNGIPPYNETQEYVQRVKALLRRYNSQG